MLMDAAYIEIKMIVLNRNRRKWKINNSNVEKRVLVLEEES